MITTMTKATTMVAANVYWSFAYVASPGLSHANKVSRLNFMTTTWARDDSMCHLKHKKMDAYEGRFDKLVR